VKLKLEAMADNAVELEGKKKTKRGHTSGDIALGLHELTPSPLPAPLETTPSTVHGI
jgi:hypothetical protein